MANSEPLFTLLRKNNLLNLPANLPEETSSPWYIKVLLAIAGWLAALFFFGFFALALLDVADHLMVRALVGTAMLISAYFILKAPQSEFFEHIALAVSLSGQALIAWALFEHLEYENEILWLVVAVIQLLLAWFMPSFLHRFFSALAAAYACTVLMAIIALPALFSSVIMLACAWLWLHEFHFKHNLQRIKAIAYGLTVALIVIKSSGSVDWLWSEHKNALSSDSIIQRFDEGINCLVLFYVSWHLLKRYQVALSSPAAITVLGASLLLGLASMQAPGLAAAMMLIVLSFAASHRILMGLGVLTSLFYISKYYYSLELTLNQKSLSLLLVGLLLLALSKALIRWQPQGGQQHE